MSNYSLYQLVVQRDPGFGCFSPLQGQLTTALEWMWLFNSIFHKNDTNILFGSEIPNTDKGNLILLLASFFWSPSLTFVQLGLVCVLVNAVRSNAHVEEADTGFTFGYMLIASVLSTHGSLEKSTKSQPHGHYFDRFYPCIAAMHVVIFHPSLTL